MGSRLPRCSAATYRVRTRRSGQLQEEDREGSPVELGLRIHVSSNRESNSVTISVVRTSQQCGQVGWWLQSSSLAAAIGRVLPHNVAAGEDIRVLTEAQARDLRLPTWDFWLFDDCWVAWLHFGDHGLAGASLTDDSVTVARCRTWRERALRYAVPFPEYS